ncbi:MAG: hypothetical protein ACLQME_07930 [Alphaproteobacteria bacterium]
MSYFDWLFGKELPPRDLFVENELRRLEAIDKALEGPYGDNATLYKVTEQLVRDAKFPDPHAFAGKTILRLVDRCEESGLPIPHFNIAMQMSVAAAQLYAAERLNDMPPNPAKYATHGITAGLGVLRDLLLLQQRKAARPQVTLDALWNTLIAGFIAITRHLPQIAQGNPDGDTVGDDIPSIPLIDILPDVGKIIEDALDAFDSPEARDIGLFRWFRGKLKTNIDLISSSRPLPPSDYRGSQREIISAYLKNTPLECIFLESRIPFEISIVKRLEHTAIIAGAGWGKTQLLQSMIAGDLEREDPPAMVVIDSTNAIIRRVQRLALFNERLTDRIIIIDPEHDPAPALNMFDVSNPRLQTYSRTAREDVEAEVINLFNYVFASLSTELTGPQSAAFPYFIRLMLSYPGATIHTLLELLEDADETQSKFAPYIARLDPTARAFFKNQFYASTNRPMRGQIARRLYGLVQVPAFERMFSTVNKLDMFAELQRGSIILVNTSVRLLKEDASSLFGRYIIARTLAAAFERAAIDEHQRKPAFLIVDEAAPYFDETFDAMLTRVRQFKLGVVIAFQHLEQASKELRSAIASNTTVKYAGGLGYTDSRWLSRDMRTTPDFVQAQRRDSREPPRFTQFACYVRNYTDSAVSLTVPFYALEGMPKMNDEELAALLERNRARVSQTASPPATPEAPTVIPAPEPVISQAPAQSEPNDASIHTEGAPDWR